MLQNRGRQVNESERSLARARVRSHRIRAKSGGSMKDKYRFDDAYETVYVYDEDAKAYLSCGSYYAYGITSDMTEEEQIRIVEEVE